MNDNLKIKIVDGNDEVELSTAPKENIKAYMVKGEAGTSSQVDVVRTGSKVVLTTTDSRGTNSVEINDGVSPTIDTSRTDNVTTVTIEDIEGIKTTEIYDGIDLTGGVPTNGVIGFDVTELIYTCDGTETGNYYLTYENVNYYFTMPTVDDGDILVFNVDDLELSLDGTVITTSSTGTGTELTFIDNIPNGYEETDESLGGADIPQQATAPINPKENDLWIDTDETGLTTVDSTVSTTSTNPVENQAITNYVDNLNTYSTTEQRVGKWINGKPLYRKVFTDSSTTSGDHEINISSINHDYISLVDWNMITRGFCLKNFGVDGNSTYANSFINSLDKKIIWATGTYWADCSYVAIVEYTKTTD